MAYDSVSRLTESYGEVWGEVDFTAAKKLNIIGPKGCVGYVRDIIVDVTTSIVGSTSVPEICVGISSTDATYGHFRLGSTATVGYNVGVQRAGQNANITGNPPRNAQDYTHHIELDGYPLGSDGVAGGTFLTVEPKGRIPKDTAAVISVVIAVGSPAGKGFVKVIVDWHGQPGY